MNDNTDRLDILHLAQRGFDRALNGGRPSEVHYDLARRLIRLRFAGPGLMPLLLPALAHRQVAARPDPHLTIHLWDTASTGARLPLLLDLLLSGVKSAPSRLLDSRYAIRALNDDRVHSAFRFEPALLSVYDAAEQTAFYWTEDAARLPVCECCSPLQTILNWWAVSQGLQYVFAAAVGSWLGAALLVGPDGSGKSTAALACLDSELRYLADDCCLVGLDRRPTVFSVYNSVQLQGVSDLALFPALAATGAHRLRDPNGTSLLTLYPGLASRLVGEAPIRAILLPRFTGSAVCRLQPVGRAEALRALAPRPMFQLPGLHQEALSRLAQLVRSVPCHRLELGHNLREIPTLLRGLLS